MTIWMDLTFSMKTRKGKGMVGIVRSELEWAQKLHEIDDEIRYFVVEKNGFRELNHSDIDWMFESESISDAYMEKWPIKQDKGEKSELLPDGLKQANNYLGRYTRRAERIELILKILIQKTPLILRWLTFVPFWMLIHSLRFLVVIVDRVNNLRKNIKISGRKEKQTVEIIPFSKKDIIFSCGWHNNETIDKEYAFSELKNQIPEIKLIYLIYDLVLVNPETAALYPEKHMFEKYLVWISNNCDFVCYDGETAKNDTEKYWKEHDLRIPEGRAIKVGSDSFKGGTIDFSRFRQENHIGEKYILAVGSIDTKKNYDVLYKAFCVINEKRGMESCPQLVIAGGKVNGKNTLNNIEFTPVIKDKICVVQPNDDELNALYENCLFTVLPSWYEGWCLTFMEAMDHGKMCLASDVAPLKEMGTGLVEYIDPADPYTWAERIYELANNIKELKNYENDIKRRWKKITWEDSAKMVYKAVCDCNEMDDERNTGSHLCFDMTLSYNSCFYNAPVSGILRTELTLLRYLCRIYPSMRLLAFTNSGPLFISRSALGDLLGNRSVDETFRELGWYLEKYGYVNINAMNKKRTTKELYWLICSVVPGPLKQHMIKRGVAMERDGKRRDEILTLPFNDGDILLSVGVGFSGVPYDVYGALKKRNRKERFKYIQLLYDFTPILYPQFHHVLTREMYGKFLKNTYEAADYMLYGGKNAERDGHNYELTNGFSMVESSPIFFGGDKVGEDPNDRWIVEQEEAEIETLKGLGIRGEFILVVSTIEPRKNHESLYYAYIDLLKKHKNLPQMVFAGFHGWNMDDFVERVQRDERVRQKLIIITPSDKALDLLYRKCKFTVLASLYEGWSLTLPESLSRGKFCLCCKTPALIEIAGELADYVDGFDIKTWSERIYYYYKNEDALAAKEKAIKENWHIITWKECAEQIASIINAQMEK